jgi:isoquinoline 1-oxidoreductase beta subunit
VAFRLAHLAAQPRLVGALRIAADKAGWASALARGRGRGVAVYRSFGSYVAMIAEVTARPAGVPRVDRVVVAADCGTVVNPDTVAAQMEGAVIFALGATVLSEITFQGGAVVEQSFADYPIMRFIEAPSVEVHLVASTEPPGGAGEPGVPPLAPAVANAIFVATGNRCRSLPIRL